MSIEAGLHLDLSPLFVFLTTLLALTLHGLRLVLLRRGSFKHTLLKEHAWSLLLLLFNLHYRSLRPLLLLHWLWRASRQGREWIIVFLHYRLLTLLFRLLLLGFRLLTLKQVFAPGRILHFNTRLLLSSDRLWLVLQSALHIREVLLTCDTDMFL